MTTIELKAKRAGLVKKQWKEYSTRGNTQRCQEIGKEIECIDMMLREKKGEEK